MVIGNLGGDVELRYTGNGEAVANFSVAANETYNDRSGQRQERVEWFNVVCWGKLAENCSQYLAKGRQVYVEGKQQTRSWESDGVKHYKTELIASRVDFLGQRGDGGGGGAPAEDAGDLDPDDLPF